MTPADRRSDWSLLARLGGIATAAVVLALALGGAAMYRAAAIQDEQILDSRLEQFGATIAAIVEEQIAAHAVGTGAALTPLKTRPTAALLYRYQVWGHDGRLMLRSHEASAVTPMVALTRFGYSTVMIGGESHRVFSLPGRSGEFVVQVAENHQDAWSQVSATSLYYVLLLLIPFALLIAVTWWLLRRAVHSISALAGELKSRNPLEMSPLPVADPPRELLPILNAIDFLFGRMQRALSIEHSFTALAAHELRTPLAGVRANAQLLTYESLPEGPAVAVSQLILGVDRAAYMLDQLLDLARVETLATSGDVQMAEVRVADVYEDIMYDVEARRRKRHVRLESRIREERLHCHAVALGVLMRNLLINAINYSPADGHVELHATVHRDRFTLIVDDSGSGIAVADREHAFERFNRLGRTRADGVGLGLSIVLLVVEMHGAKIQLLDSPLGGLRVAVEFSGGASGA